MFRHLLCGRIRVGESDAGFRNVVTEPTSYLERKIAGKYQEVVILKNIVNERLNLTSPQFAKSLNTHFLFPTREFLFTYLQL